MTTDLQSFLRRALAHNGFRKYFANTSWLFAEQILRIIAGLLVGIYVARYLGPEKLGLFSYALAFVALFASIAKLGLDGVVVKALVETPKDRDIYLGTAFFLKIMGAILAGAVIAVALVFANNDTTTNIFIGIIASGLIFQAFEVVDFYFQSRVLSKYISICKITQLAISSLIKLYLVSTDAELLWFVLVSLVDQSTLSIALVYSYSRQKQGNFYSCFEITVAKKLLLSAKPLIISGVLVSMYASIDKVIIKELIGVREVGLYAAATTLVNTLYFIPTLIANSLFPAILNAKKKSEEIYIRRLSLMYKFSLSFGLLICLFVSIYAASIINFLYGQSFSDSAGVLQIYIWNFLVISFSTIFGKWLLSENMQKLLPRFTLMAIVVNVIACLYLVPIWSIKGAAIAALSTQLIPFAWFSIRNKEIRSQLSCAFGNK